MQPNLLRTHSEEEYAQLGAEWILEALEQSLTRNRTCTLMLAGGTAPLPVYRRLAEVSKQRALGELWDRIHIFFGDERCVPPDHEESNYRQAMESLLGPLGIAPENVFRMHAESADIQQAAREYELKLPKPVDVMLLGMGEDAHTASLFPGDPAAAKLLSGVAPVVAPKPPPNRLTILPTVITQARTRLLMIKGTSKHAALRTALQGPWNPPQAPVQWALCNRSTWLLDSEASSFQAI